jgi:hypothetical protein
MHWARNERRAFGQASQIHHDDTTKDADFSGGVHRRRGDIAELPQ